MPPRSHSGTRTAAVAVQPAGTPSLADERTEVVLAVLEGLPPQYFEILRRLVLSEQTQDQICAEMGLTETQLRLRKSQARAKLAELVRKTLTRKQSAVKHAATKRASPKDAVVDVDRIIPIVAHAVAVFGDEQKASHWLATPLRLLGNRSPVQILTRGGDFEAIDVVLTRIEHNIPS